MEGAGEEVSNEVDKHIVEMEFKNAEFEKNANKTLSTLQALKDKLNGSFSTRAAEDLNRSIKSVDISPISKGIDTVQMQFSALQIAGKRVIENIVDAAMSGLANIKNKLTSVIDMVKTGGANRAQNIEQAKFMLKGFGIEWSQIEGDISYGVQDTAYGLDAAAKVASQLVASSVNLGDDMRQALRGISGVAAMTNSTYEDIGRIYTQVAGQGRLMGDQLLQLSGRGINAAATLGKALNKSEAEIRDMTSKGQINFKMFAEAMDNAFGEHAKEANSTFSGVMSNTRAALSRLGADVQAAKFDSIRIILTEVIPKLKELKKAIKPIEDAIITLTTSVGKLVAGIVKTIDIKSIVERITPPIEKAVKVMNEFVEAAALIFGTEGIHNKNDAAFFAEQKALGKLKDSTKEAKDEIVDLINITPEQVKKAHAIWDEGAYGNGIDRVRALGDEYKIVQGYVEKMIEFGWDEAKMEEYLAEQTKKHEEENTKIINANKRIKQIENLRQILTNLKTVVKNVFGSIGNVLKVAFESMSSTFSNKSVLEGIVSITDKIANFSNKIYISKERAQKLKPAFEALFTVLKFGATILVNIAKILGKVIMFASELIVKAKNSKIIQGIVEGISNAIRGLLDGIEKIYTKIKESGVWDKFVEIVKIVAVWVGERLIDAFNRFGDIASAVGDGISSIWDKMIGKVKGFNDENEKGQGFLDKIKDFFKEDVLHGSWLEKLKEIMTDIFGTGKDVFQRAFTMGSDFVSGLIKGIRSIDEDDLEFIIGILTKVGITLSTMKWLYSMIAINKSFKAFGDNLSEVFGALTNMVKKYGKRADADRFKAFATSVAIITGSLIALMVAFAALEGYGYDAKRVLTIAAVVVGIIGGIVGLILVLNTWLEKAKINTAHDIKTVNVLGNTKIPAFALTLFSMAFMVQTLIRTIITVYNMMKKDSFDSGKFILVASILLGVMTGIAILVGVISKISPKMAGLSGLAWTLVSMALLLGTITSSFKKILKAVEGKKGKDIRNATDVVKDLLVPILLFAGAVALINKIPNTSATATNPFKGMLGMFTGLAILLRVGFVPLLKTLVDIRKEGKDGRAAVRDFKSLVTSLMIFIGAITTVLAVLDRVVSVGGKQLGTAFVDGKMVGGVTGGGFNTNSKGGLFWGVAAIVAAMAAMFAFIGKALKSMKGVERGNIRNFKEMVEVILIGVGALSLLAGLGSMFAGPAVIGGLAAMAAMLLSVAAVMISAGYGFKAFEEGLKDLVTSLPEMEKSLLQFFDNIKADKEDLISGIAAFIGFLFDGFNAAFLSWTENMILLIPTMVDNLWAVIVEFLDTTGEKFMSDSPEMVDAVDKFAIGLTYFLGLVMQRVQERGKEMFGDVLKEIFAVNNPIGRSLLGMEDVGKGRSIDDQLKALEEEAEEIGQHTAYSQYEAYAKTMKEEAEKRQGSIKEYEGFDISDVITVDEDKLDQTINNLVANMKTKAITKLRGANLSELTGLANFDMSEITGMISSGNIGDVSNMVGFDMNQYEGLWDDIDLSTEEGGNQLLERLQAISGDGNDIFSNYVEGFTEYGEDSMNNLHDGIEERMEFVTQITKDVADKSVDEMKKYDSKFYDAGKYCAQGFADGLLNQYAVQRIKQNASDLVDIAEETIRDTGKIASPSKVFMALGRFITMGFAEGIGRSVGLATRSTSEVGEATILSMRETIKRITEDTMYGVDTNPRITPVLDMSNVTDGINFMNNAFNTDRAIRLGAITSTEAKASNDRRATAYYQNGSVFDDSNTVASIETLRGELAGLKDSINGMQVVMDGRALVGQIVTPMDKALGKKVLAGRRGI